MQGQSTRSKPRDRHVLLLYLKPHFDVLEIECWRENSATNSHGPRGLVSRHIAPRGQHPSLLRHACGAAGVEWQPPDGRMARTRQCEAGAGHVFSQHGHHHVVQVFQKETRTKVLLLSADTSLVFDGSHGSHMAAQRQGKSASVPVLLSLLLCQHGMWVFRLGSDLLTTRYVDVSGCRFVAVLLRLVESKAFTFTLTYVAANPCLLCLLTGSD